MKRIREEEKIDKSRLNQGQPVGEGDRMVIEGVAEDRRTEDVGDFSVFRALLQWNVDLCHYFLSSNDWDTLSQLRLVSKSIWEQSMRLGGGLSPLMSRILIAFSINQLLADPARLEFAQERTRIHVREIDISHLRNPALLSDNIDFKKAQVSLAFKVNNNAELKELSELLTSNELSEKQKLILRKIKELEFARYNEDEYNEENDEFEFFVNVDNENIPQINTVLSYFGATERASQLTRLSFGIIRAQLMLPELPSLTNVKFGHIKAALTLPELPNLTKLSFWNIESELTLQDMPSLTTLSIRNIYTAPTLQGMPSLTTLSIGEINAELTLPELPSLTMLSFRGINATLTMSEMPSLMTLKFMDIFAPLTLPELPRLTTLSFLAIEEALTLQEMPSLMTLKFGDIFVPLTLPELRSLTELSFGDIQAFLTLQEMPSLTTLSFGSIEAWLKLPEMPNLTTLSFRDIYARLDWPAWPAWPALPKLMTLKFEDINAMLKLPMLQSLTRLSVQNVNAKIWLPVFPHLQQFLAIGDINPMLNHYK